MLSIDVFDGLSYDQKYRADRSLGRWPILSSVRPEEKPDYQPFPNDPEVPGPRHPAPNLPTPGDPPQLPPPMTDPPPNEPSPTPAIPPSPKWY